MSDFQPMLAGEAPKDIQFPVMASAKLDGIRCIVVNGVAMSRSFKPIPNKHVQAMLANGFDGLDGELIVGPMGAPDVYRKTNSAVMSRDGKPEFTFYVFDNIYAGDSTPYRERYYSLSQANLKAPATLLEHVMINNDAELLAYEADKLNAGLEGLCLRDPNGPYKYGRSSTKQGWLLKLKRFSDSEAEIIGVQELLSNQNVATKDAFGHTERSDHKDNKVPMNTLGALLVRDIKTGVEFAIGTGFDAKTRKELWEQSKTKRGLQGEIVKYKFFNNGIKDAPRFPIFMWFRDPIDMS